MNLLAFIHIPIVAALEFLRAYTMGTWFMLTRPREFIAFVKVWRDYKDQIAAVDLVRESGYFGLTRAQRRRAGRAIK